MGPTAHCNRGAHRYHMLIRVGIAIDGVCEGEISTMKVYQCSIVQIATLNEAHKVHPNVKWWLKGDGCDIVSGLEESVRLEWNGDVDMGDGDLQRVYSLYCNRLKALDALLRNAFIREDRGIVLNFLGEEQNRLAADITFITIGMSIAARFYLCTCIYMYHLSTCRT